jgi:hypothetical protein
MVIPYGEIDHVSSEDEKSTTTTTNEQTDSKQQEQQQQQLHHLTIDLKKLNSPRRITLLMNSIAEREQLQRQLVTFRSSVR